jgi:hypothetical protein
LCRNAGIHGYSKMTKSILFDEYNKFLAVKQILVNFRKHLYRNAVDSITLEPVEFPCFIYRVKTGKVFFYEYDSIIKYIMKSGKTVDPNTRNVYTDLELLRLDQQAKIYFPDKNFKSTYRIKHNENYARRIRNRENQILVLQMRLEEISTSIVTIIADDIISWNLTDVVIDNVEYTSFAEYILALKHELKFLFVNLKNYSEFEANCFRTNFVSQLNDQSPHSKLFTDILV